MFVAFVGVSLASSSSMSMLTFFCAVRFSSGKNFRCWLYMGSTLINNPTWSTFKGWSTTWTAFALHQFRKLEKHSFFSYWIIPKSPSIIDRSTLYEYWCRNFLKRSSQFVIVYGSIVLYHYLDQKYVILAYMYTSCVLKIIIVLRFLFRFICYAMKNKEKMKKMKIWATN